jgi:hypothetical protein
MPMAAYALLFVFLVLNTPTLVRCQIEEQDVHGVIHGTGSLGRAPWRRMGDTVLHETLPTILIHLGKLETAIEEGFLELLKVGGESHVP